MDARVVFILSLFGIVHCKLLNSCSIKESFVNGHNGRRLNLAKGKVPGQPAASRMTYLVWDEELATKAQKWASGNTYGHNPNKTIPSRRFDVGENIYIYKTTDMRFNFNPEMAMKSWWDEYKSYNYGKMTKALFNKPQQVGHYTQMAWANTYRIGCGISQYVKNNWNNFFVVCNYGPPGNFLGETPYKTGRASGRLVCHQLTDCNSRYGKNC